MRSHELASRVGYTESLEMHDLVALHDAQGDAGDVHRLHLRCDIGVNRLKIGGLQLEPSSGIVPRMRRRRRKQKDAQTEQSRPACGPKDETFHTSERSPC